LDLIELDRHDEVDIRKVRLTSLRSFGKVFVPTEVVVLRGRDALMVPSRQAMFPGHVPDIPALLLTCVDLPQRISTS
jgi:hypothetical protein